MAHMILQAAFGLAVGAIAKFLLPGHNPGGLITTAIIGMAGGWLGGRLGTWLGWYSDGHPAGFGLSVVGAMVLLLAYRML